MSEAHIFVVEDEESFVDALEVGLAREGFTVSVARDGFEALEKFDEVNPDLVLLDVMLPRVTGIEVCRQLKSGTQTARIPVIMLSARSEEVDKIRGLETGADDYVTKPYSLAELLARTRSQLRRTRPSSVGETLEYEDIKLDTSAHRAFRGETQINLGPTEFRLLTAFMERPGRVWSREQLLDRVWGRDIYVDSRTVDVHVGRLRKALRGGGEGDPIRTVRGAGYALG